MSDLSNAIEDHVNRILSKQKLYSAICKVVSVDDTKRTCDVEPINGDAERTGRIQASLDLTEGLYIKPAVNSFVQLTWINEITGIITNFSEIEEYEIKIGSSKYKIIDGDIIFNEGNDNAVRFSELKSGFDELRGDLNNIISSYNSHIHITTATVGASTVPGTIAPTTSTGTPSAASVDGAKVDEIKMP